MIERIRKELPNRHVHKFLFTNEYKEIQFEDFERGLLKVINFVKTIDLFVNVKKLEKMIKENIKDVRALKLKAEERVKCNKKPNMGDEPKIEKLPLRVYSTR